MTIAHTPLAAAALSPAAQKALAAPASRAMAARGLVPLPPREQLAVLYAIAIDPAVPQVAEQARATAMGLPDSLLAGALADPAADPRVLDFFAQLVGDRSAVFAALVGNSAIADATVAYLADTANGDEIERIATNEQRLLRHPEIIAAMYTNKLARMSTVDRVVELAVRNHVRVPGLAAWDEIARALEGGTRSGADADAAFAEAAKLATIEDDPALVAGDPDAIADDDDAAPAAAAAPVTHDKREALTDVAIARLSVPAKIRLAQLGNATTRGVLVRDPVKMVAVSAIKATSVSEFEAARYAGNATLDEGVIRFIASRRDWTKLPGIKYSLCKNPKTPMTEAVKLLQGLRDRDLQQLSKSKGVPSAVAAQARKIIQNKGGPKR